jgi:anti-sigma factor RsiW
MIEAYVDGRLEGSVEGEFLSHVRSCPLCRAEIDAEEALVRGLESLPLVDPGREFTAAVMERILGDERLASREGVLQGILTLVGNSVHRFPRLAGSSLLVIALLASLLLPVLLKSGAISLLKRGTGVFSLLTDPVTRLAVFLHDAGGALAPLAKALFLALKVSVEFILTLIGTQQFSFVLVASIVLIMTASIFTAFHLTMARRRIRHATVHL